MNFEYSLIETCLSHAENSLKTIGGFSPFARLVLANGSIESLKISDELSTANSQEIAAQIELALNHIVDNQDICMLALCSDIQFKTEASTGDAILMRIDGRAIQAVDILIPYEQRDNLFFYGQMIQQAGSLSVFSDIKQ